MELPLGENLKQGISLKLPLGGLKGIESGNWEWAIGVELLFGGLVGIQSGN